MVKKCLFLLFLVCSISHAEWFFYGVCSGYEGDIPVVGKYIGNFSNKRLQKYQNVNIGLGGFGPIIKTSYPDGHIKIEYGTKEYSKIGEEYYTTTPGLYFTYINQMPYTFSIGENDIDTVLKIDTIKITVAKIKIDTLIKIDTIRLKDTLIKIKIDTFKVSNTIIKNDTVTKIMYDTVTEIQKDTVKISQVVNGFKESDKFYYEKLHIDFGKPTKTYSGISYGSFDDSGFVSSSPTIQIHTNIKSNVRIFVYDNIGTFVDKEEFRISENKYYYFSFNGYNSIKQKVVNGIYLIRVITEQNNKFSNTVYKVGIKND